MVALEETPISRRSMIRGVSLSGLAILASSAVTLGAAGPASASTQSAWCWCERCEGLWYNGHKGYGRCPAGGGHSNNNGGNYTLYRVGEGVTGQPDWCWCERCEGLWYNAHKGYGRCPTGGGHSNNNGGNYVLPQA